MQKERLLIKLGERLIRIVASPPPRISAETLTGGISSDDTGAGCRACTRSANRAQSRTAVRGARRGCSVVALSASLRLSGAIARKRDRGGRRSHARTGELRSAAPAASWRWDASDKLSLHADSG